MSKFILLIVLTLSSLLTNRLSAALVYGTSVPSGEWTSSRNEVDLIVGGNYDTAGNTLKLDWKITPITGGYHYEYTFSGYPSPGISHMILDLTDDAVFPVVDPGAVTNPAPGTGLAFGTFDDSMGNSNSGLAGPITGVKFEFGGSSPYTFSFDSNRAPVWGDIYIKGGSDSYALNKGVTLHDTSMNTLDFVARPNGTAVPEPSSMVLVGLCGAGVAWRRFRWFVRAS